MQKMNAYLYRRRRELRQREDRQLRTARGRAPFHLLPAPLTRRQWRRLADVELDRRPLRIASRWDRQRTIARPSEQQRRAFRHGVVLFLDGHWPTGAHSVSAGRWEFSVRAGWAWALGVAERAGDPRLLSYASMEVDGLIPIRPDKGGRAYYHTWPGMGYGTGCTLAVEDPDAPPVLPPPPAWMPPLLTPDEQAVYVALLSHKGSDTRWVERQRRGRTDAELREDVRIEMGSAGGFAMPWADREVSYRGGTNGENGKGQTCRIDARQAARGWFPPYPKRKGEWRPGGHAPGDVQLFAWLVSPGEQKKLASISEDAIVGMARKLFAVPYPGAEVTSTHEPVVFEDPRKRGQLALF